MADSRRSRKGTTRNLFISGLIEQFTEKTGELAGIASRQKRGVDLRCRCGMKSGIKKAPFKKKGAEWGF
jgi:hypothetical protein